MIHFAYPNVDTSLTANKKIVRKFSGCGRYARLLKKRQGYEKANPQATRLTEIYDALKILVPESSGRLLEISVYEKKDDPNTEYIGDSQDLAYLLACINFFREIALKTSGDIWCTGSIDPPHYLNEVTVSAFDVKLNAFLSEENNDNLFIVPIANILKGNKKDEILSEYKNVEFISIEQFQVAEYTESFKKKTILVVHGNELESLVKKIFVKSSDKKKPCKPPQKKQPVLLSQPKKEPWIQFSYPNVRTGSFLGCGRYTASSQNPREEYYKVADPKTLNLAKILQAIEKLAPESDKKTLGKNIYEIRDDPGATYMGDSQDLAYLLALINRSRKIAVETEDDIWCTGTIGFTDNKFPFLDTVIDSGFDVKLNEFLSEKNRDKLFIVPKANVRETHQILIKAKNAKDLTLNKFEFSDQRKTILKVQGGELESLVAKIFEPPPIKGEQIKEACLVTSCITLLMLLLCWLQFFDYFHLDTKLERYTIGAGDLFVKKTFNDDKIALVAVENKGFDKTWREHHATLIDKLSKAGAKVIVFDMYFEEPSGFDENFADAIITANERGTEVVIGILDLQNGKTKISEELRSVIEKNYGIVCISEKESYATEAPLVLRKKERRPLCFSRP